MSTSRHWPKVSPADRSACRVTNYTEESGRIRWGSVARKLAISGAVWQKSALDLKFRFLHAAVGPNSRRVNAYPRFRYLRRTLNFLPKSQLLLCADKAGAATRKSTGESEAITGCKETRSQPSRLAVRNCTPRRNGSRPLAKLGSFFWLVRPADRPKAPISTCRGPLRTEVQATSPPGCSTSDPQ